tara:strand:- start:435 stop:1040 length:606 start_codon:yes stop_codon:yes gene_type:complete
MIKAVLFDMDGVLVNSFEAWLVLVNATAKHFGYPEITRERFEAAYGQSTESDVEEFFQNQTAKEVDDYYEKHFKDFKSLVQPVPEAYVLIETLKEMKLGVCVITNTGGNLARDILEELEITADHVIGGDEVENAKPAPDIVLKACEFLDVRPTEALVVGDSVYDMGAASTSGAISVGIHGVIGDYSIDSLLELPEIIKNRQ